MNFCAGSTLFKPGVHSRHGVCVAQNAHAARIGAEILGQGGNACDAAVAVSFALGVLEPWMSGIGGGGGLLMHDAAAGRVLGIDFGLVAPKGLDPATYSLTEGYCDDLFPWRRVIEDRNLNGVHAAATPGVVAGMGRLHAHGGRMPWAELLAPAISLAREGVPGDWYSQLFVSTNFERLRSDPALCDTFLPAGTPAGSATLAGGRARWRLPALAATLDRLARAGWEDFYRGDIAHTLGEEIAAAGGSLGTADLERYQATLGDAQNTRYRDSEVYLAPGLSAGKTLARTLALMPDTPGGDWHRHMARALHGAQAERWAHDGDMSETATPQKPADCTTHFAVSDSAGNLVSVTQTILSVFGAAMMLPRSGILLNNGMMWFDPQPGKPNSLAPGKRCLMNICPTILRHDGRHSAVGAAGGRRILSAVAQLVGALTDHGMDGEAAIHAPRMDCSQSGQVTRHPDLAPLALSGIAETVAQPHPWPLTYAIPSVLTVHGEGSSGYADPVSPWAAGAAPHSVPKGA